MNCWSMASCPSRKKNTAGLRPSIGPRSIMRRIARVPVADGKWPFLPFVAQGKRPNPAAPDRGRYPDTAAEDPVEDVVGDYAPTTLPSSSTASRRSNATSPSPPPASRDSAACACRRLAAEKTSRQRRRCRPASFLGVLAADPSRDGNSQLLQSGSGRRAGREPLDRAVAGIRDCLIALGPDAQSRRSNGSRSAVRPSTSADRHSSNRSA